MKRFTVAEARARFGDMLDEADRGETVVIERRNVRYTLKPEPVAKRKAPHESPFEWIDPVVMSGQWTWTLTKNGLRFKARKRR